MLSQATKTTTFYSYPTQANINGVIYDINYDTETALRCFKLINDDSVSDYERNIGVCVMLFGENVPLCQETTDKAVKFLQCGKEVDNDTDDEVIDYEHDKSYIIASFESDYKIDLTLTNLHWWKFNDLLSGLSENAILSRIVEIRMYDPSNIKDAKEKAKLIKAKRKYGLPNKENESKLKRRNELIEALRKGEFDYGK